MVKERAHCICIISIIIISYIIEFSGMLVKFYYITFFFRMRPEVNKKEKKLSSQ